ncbi:MAG TPA: CpsD/CapB family tyrosine-protein kinase [Clostridia bacterium]|nr:CpsD/CapB family tyrosine-protein kinase [Clostridia bacterium]
MRNAETFSRQEKKRANLILTQTGSFEFIEAFNALRTNLQFASLNRPLHKIVVTSSVIGEGKSTIAVNLAISLAEISYHVLLIDADLRRPNVHKLLGIDNVAGLTTAITEARPWEKCITKIDEDGLSVMTSGPIPPNPVELLVSDRFKQLISALGAAYDFIVIDSPPVSMITDAAVISVVSDGVLFVIRQDYTSFEAVKTAQKNLENVNANLIGCVLNSFKRKDHLMKYGDYYKRDG